MGSDHRREQSAKENSENWSSLDHLKSWIVDAGPILSLSGIVILAGGIVVWLTISELRGAAQILVSLALIMLITSTVTHLSAVRNVVTARTGRYAANTLVMVIALTAILGLISFISLENVFRIDLTATRQFTLAPQTEKILDDLTEPLKAIVYSSPQDARQEQIRRRADDFFFEFNRRNRNFTFEFVDPDLTPSQARRDGVEDYPTIAFKLSDSEHNPYLLTPLFFGEELALSEQDLVSAILIATGEKQKVVYFTTGHGERKLEDANEESTGFGLARAGLLGDNYLVRSLNLKQVEAIPADTAVLILAGPRNSILQDERDKIERYLKDGGRAMFLLDDAINTQMNNLLNKWGMELPQGNIVDIGSSTTSDPRSPIIRRGSYNLEHPITKPLDDTFFTETTGILDIILKAPEGLPRNPDERNITLTPLAVTSVASCITTESDSNDCLGNNDLFGPFPIAMAVEAITSVGEEPDPVVLGEERKVSSIVVFGDSDFVSNKFYYALNNSDFFLNAVDWLAKKYDLISIRSKPQAFRLLIIDQKEFDFIRYSSWFLLPTGIVLLAGISWWRRR
jgi:ABC-type uncharacterized transport system involved in gliding motility auxiliary subunit